MWSWWASPTTIGGDSSGWQYGYFALHALGIEVWWKRFLTTAQIMQFAIGLFLCAMGLVMRILGEILGVPGVPLVLTLSLANCHTVGWCSVMGATKAHSLGYSCWPAISTSSESCIAKPTPKKPSRKGVLNAHEFLNHQ